VSLDEDMRYAAIIASRNETRSFGCLIFLNVERPIPDPVDPREASRRIEYLEERLEHSQEYARILSDVRYRTITAQFRPVSDHWLNANCTLEGNQWALTNEWIARELDPDLIRAQYPVGTSPDDDRQAEEFFAQWREGDRLFSYGTPAHLRGPRYGEWGYIIVRECRVVAKLIVGMS